MTARQEAERLVMSVVERTAVDLDGREAALVRIVAAAVEYEQAERHADDLVGVGRLEERAAAEGRIEDATRELVAAVRALDGRTVDAAAGVFEGGPESTGWLRQQREADDE